MRDLPVPGWLFLYGAAVVLIVSFVALGTLWKRPLLERHADGRPLPPWAQRILLGPELRLVLGAVSLALLVLVFAAALVGEDSVATNVSPTFVYVVFWLVRDPVVVLLGNVWRALNPWRALVDGIAWLAARAAPPWRPPLAYDERVGVWPATILLFAFATLELAYPHASNPRTLAAAIAIYSWVTWLGAALYGRAWFDRGEAFTIYFGLLARLAPFAVRTRDEERVVVVQPPLTGLTRTERRPGLVAFLAVMLGSVAFDGFSRTSFWQERLFAIESSFPIGQQRRADLAVTAFNTLGLLGMVALVALVYLTAVEAARVAGRARESLAADFAASLVPIALAYAVAHYFSLLVLQGQAMRRLVSDPFGYGWDVFGTANFQPRLDLLAPNTIWYAQVGTLVVGHVLGLVLAHDRAIVLFRSSRVALRTQYAMLVLMVAYTVGGLWLLSND